MAIILIGVVCGLLVLRELQVYFHRDKVIDYLFDQPNWGELIEKFHQVSMTEMVIKFWKPLDSFFPEELKLKKNK